MIEREIHFKGHDNNTLFSKLYAYSNDNLPGIIFCHGFKTDHTSFSDVPYSLAKLGFKTFVFDYSGHGNSEGENNFFSSRSHIEDTNKAISVFKEQNISKIFILGHSLGSHAAVLSLINNADINAGILVTPMRAGGENLDFFKRFLFNCSGLAYRLFGNLLPDIYMSAPKKIESGVAKQRYNLRYSAYSTSINDAKLVKFVDKPVLFIISEKDQVIAPTASMDVFSKTMSSQKELLLLKRSGHDVFRDVEKDIIIGKIEEFVTKYKEK